VSVPGLTFWLVGFLLGLRHALEPDHLAAVSNLALTSGRPLKAALAGALWGLEHLFTLAAVAGVALALGLRLPAAFGFLTELVVALALAWLGLSTPLGLRVRRTMGPSYRSRSPLRNPFLWGVLHGLSGSAALVLLASSQLTYPLQATSPWVRGCLRRGRFLGYVSHEPRSGPLLSLGGFAGTSPAMVRDSGRGPFCFAGLRDAFLGDLGAR
jgi:hypothetical protein